MSYRHKATKPSVALWMLIALADLALLMASGGLFALVTIAVASIVAVAAVGLWLVRRGMPAGGAAVPVRVPVSTVTRRRG